MKKVFYVFIAVIAIFTLAGCASTEKSISTATVTANAELKLQPDIARFSISAEAVENTTDEARAKTSEMVNNAIDILTSNFGIDIKDISTNYINVTPYYVWKDNERVLQGQSASQSINVTLRDINKYGDVFESLSKINGISVSNASLDKLDKAEDFNTVRSLAIKAAYDKANAYAEAAGLKLGSVISISDSSSPSYSYPNVMLAKASYDSESSTAYYAGDITLSDSVTVVYQLVR